MGVACPEIDRLPPGGHGEPLVPAFEPMPTMNFQPFYVRETRDHDASLDAARSSKGATATAALLGAARAALPSGAFAPGRGRRDQAR